MSHERPGDWRRARQVTVRVCATFLGIPFVNAGEITTTDGVDGIHFTAENN